MTDTGKDAGKETGTVLASGNLATARRTAAGVLGQLALLQVDDSDALAIVTDVGLPARMLEEPDFPISLEQELLICLALSRRLGPSISAMRFFADFRSVMGIENLGVLGMAMRYAANTVESLAICLTYPQLTWGHSRMVVRKLEGAARFSFSMERPDLPGASQEELDWLVQYCLSLDLFTSMRNIEDVAGSGLAPLYITFPFPEPADWRELADPLACPVHFSAADASLVYPAEFDDTPLPRSNPIQYKYYVGIAEQMSRMLAEDISLSERVVRWLWAYSPPPHRAQMAELLAMSERSLTRKLRAEGHTFAGLLAEVQSERARNLLRNRSLTVTEIGERLGYSDPAAFSRAFSSWTGQSPVRWRQGL